MICSKCSAELSEDSDYCSKCGKKIERAYDNAFAYVEPNVVMKYSREKFMGKFKEKGLSLKCPVCSSTEFFSGECMTSPREIEETDNHYNYVKGGKLSPQIQVICTNCGVITEFSTLILFK